MDSTQLSWIANVLWTIAANVSSALLLLCGTNFSIWVLLPALQAIAYALPLTRGIAATRSMLTGVVIGRQLHHL
jgi:uncharacterized phage infection (PIP) family protein YhgE